MSAPKGSGVVRFGRSRLSAPGPVWALAGALCLAPLYDRNYHFGFDLGPYPTTLLEVALAPALAYGLVRLGLDLEARRRLRARLPWLIPVVLLVFGATLGVAVAHDRRGALGLWKAYFVEPALAAVILVAFCRGWEESKVVLLGMAGAGLVAALPNEAYALYSIARHTYSVETPPVTLFRTANAVPLLLVPLQALAAAIGLHCSERPARRSAAAFLVITVPAVLLSLSRAGLITLAVSLAVVGLFHPRRIWVLAAVVAGALVSLGVPAVRHRLLVEFDPSSPQNTINLRRELWCSTWLNLRRHPVSGLGLRGFQGALSQLRCPGYRENLIDPHNFVLNFWAETGLIGLAGYLALLGGMVVRGLRLASASPPWRAIGIGALAMVVAWVLHGLVDVPFFKNDLSLITLAAYGLVVGVGPAPGPGGGEL